MYLPKAAYEPMKGALGKGPVAGRRAQEKQRVFESVVVPELNWKEPERSDDGQRS